MQPQTGDNTKDYAVSRAYADEELAGTIVAGKYKLLQKIGDGGMGTVWMADQTEPVKRRVAVKLINADRGSSRSILSRFEAERQAIALMDHPHIAKLLDAGTADDGTPFFVMELVKGVRLTEYCDAHQLTIPQRLHVFQQICSAVQHAHQKGIIHRDLKPSNILVESHDGQPVPMVIDFGLAKATSGMQLTDHTLFTAFGMVAGTPLYMAPEQAYFNAVDIDTRADVYSLGVLLYELLTGTTPITRETYKSTPFDEMLRLVREQEAPTPSSRLSSASNQPGVAANRRCEPAKLGRFVKGELDWIVMKALAKERDRRYETANAFARDVERFLNHEPVQAGPPSVRYRMRKFVRRNRPQVVAAGLVLLALLAGIAGTSYGLVQANRATDDQRLAKLEAQDQKVKAQEAEAETLAEFRASTEDAIEQLIGSKPEVGPAERTYLENTLKRWRVFANRQGDDERSRAIRSEGHLRVAFLWAKLGRMDEARAEWEQARDIQQKLVEQFPNMPAYRSDLSGTCNNLGNLLVVLGEHEAARVEFDAARNIRSALVAQFPDETRYQADLAGTYNNVGILHYGLGQFEAARLAFQSALDLQLRVVARLPDDSAQRRELAGIYNNLGNLFADLGLRDQARAKYEAARDIWSKLVEQFPAAPRYRQNLAITRYNLANLLVRLQERDKAQAEYEAARAIQAQLVEDFPAVPAYALGWANTRGNLGNLLRNIGSEQEAKAECVAARDIKKKLVAKFPDVPEYQHSLAVSHVNLAKMLGNMEVDEDALAEFEAAIEIETKLVEKFPDVPKHREELANTHNEYGVLLGDLGRRDAERAQYELSIGIHKKLAEEFPNVTIYQVQLGGGYCNYGDVLRLQGEPGKGLEWLNLAVKTLQHVHAREPGNTSARLFLRNSHDCRAQAFDELKKFAEAIADWDKAIELSPPAERAAIRADRAFALVNAYKFAEAAAEVAELTRPNGADTKSPDWSARRWYDFACIYAVASAKLPERKQELADRAMEMLHKSVAAGNNDGAYMSKDADLVPLRGREDFAKLMADLKQ